MKSSFNALYPDQRQGKDVYLQGSRQMDSVTRQYYERSLGAGMFVSPMTENGLVGYSEPFRRFVQHEGFAPQVNEIANDMPSWIPGDDHLIDFKKGDRTPRWMRAMPGCRAPDLYIDGLGAFVDHTEKLTSRTGDPTPPRGPFVPHPQKLTSRARRQPPPLALVPSTASQAARHSPPQRFPACFYPPGLLSPSGPGIPLQMASRRPENELEIVQLEGKRIRTPFHI